MAGHSVHPTRNMNTCIHHALRRDLERLDRVSSGPVPDSRRAALGRHVPWMLDFLHHHHVGEDDGVWPRVLAKRPDLQQLVDTMAGEHAALATASDGLREAVAAWAPEGTEEQRQEVADAVGRMRDAALPHLDHEEQDAMPIVVETLDDEDWVYLSRNHFRKGLSFSDNGRSMMWVLDDLEPDYAAVVRSELPALLMWLFGRLYGPAYDRDATACWGDLAGRRA